MSKLGQVCICTYELFGQARSQPDSSQVTTFRLYSKDSGRNILEKEWAYGGKDQISELVSKY